MKDMAALQPDAEPKQTEPSHTVRPPGQQNLSDTNTMKKYVTVVYVILVVLGVGTGFLLSRNTAAGTPLTSGDIVGTEKTVGSSDTQTFKDSAQGTLEKGGLDGEGTHKLIREGGPSQTVYLTSSVVDLDQFAGKKVKVWGQTIAAQKAAWLMDVGKVEQE